MKKVLVFDGDFMYPLREYDDNIPYDYEKVLSKPLINSINTWINKYDKYTALSEYEKREISHILTNLEDEGISLTKEIANQLSEVISKIYYNSLFKHSLLISFYSDGSEMKISDSNDTEGNSSNGNGTD